MIVLLLFNPFISDLEKRMCSEISKIMDNTIVKSHTDGELWEDLVKLSEGTKISQINITIDSTATCLQKTDFKHKHHRSWKL